MRTVEYKLPSYLSSYLINGDSSGISVNDIDHFQEWLTNENVGSCLGIVKDLGFCWTNDYNNLGGDCCTFSFTY